ncbi:MAG: c-type cytochrome [Steroidobacteraceae bacterium]
MSGADRLRTRRRFAGCIALSLIGSFGTVHAGIFDDPKNLKVLPKDISAQALRQTMRGFALDLGLECQHCHVGEPGQPLESFDFAVDRKDRKATARLMLRMVADINERALAELDRPSDERVIVNCATCHRGLPKPLLIGDALGLAYREGGAPAAVTRYLTLKEEFFGSGSYDFTEQPRLEFASALAAQSDNAGGIAFLFALREEFGAGFMTHLLLADLYLAAGDRKNAVGQLETARTMAPPVLQESIGKRIQGIKP